jgi:hypothetical protein
MIDISWRLHAACSFCRKAEREMFELTVAGAPPGCFSILLHQPSNAGAEPATDAEVHRQHHAAGGREDCTHRECAHNDDIRRPEEGKPPGYSMLCTIMHEVAQVVVWVKLLAACKGGADMDEPQPSHLPRRGDCQGVGLGAGAISGCPDIATCKTSTAWPRAVQASAQMTQQKVKQ